MTCVETFIIHIVYIVQEIRYTIKTILMLKTVEIHNHFQTKA